MKYPYKIHRLLRKEKLRGLCAERGWYTNGSYAEYTHMLNMADKDGITSDDIVEIALDIIAHSKLESDDLLIVCDDILGRTISFMS